MNFNLLERKTLSKYTFNRVANENAEDPVAHYSGFSNLAGARRPAQVTGYFKHLRRVLFVFHKAAVIGDEIVLRLLYNFLLLLCFNLKTLTIRVR